MGRLRAMFQRAGASEVDTFIQKNGLFGFPSSRIEEQLDVLTTTRNWSTVTKIANLARSRAPG